ncbi:MAG: TonB-dependent receptor [Polyangiales bacterium]
MSLKSVRRAQAGLLAAVLLAAGAAHADERAEARRHFRAGLALVREGRYLAAVEEFQSAYRILPNVNVLFNIARAYSDAGETERALEFYAQYLQGDVPDRADVEATVRDLQQRLRAAQPAPAPSPAPPTPSPNPTPTAPDPTAPSTPAPAPTPVTAPGPLSPEQVARLREAARAVLAATDATTPPDPPATPSAPTPTPVTPAPVPPARRDADARDDTYEEQVVSATLSAQSPLDAPNAITILTQQDIRLSGLTSVPELLRRAVGVDVMALDASDQQVGVRGFNRRLSNRTLVLLDGRSIYLDFLGVTLWPLLPVGVEEIERIEVIRGGGSALYGADAYSGVINIITRAPGERRNVASVGIGNGGQLRGSVTSSGRTRGVSYRLGFGYDQAAPHALLVGPSDVTYRLNVDDRGRALQNLRADLDLSAQLSRAVSLRGGVSATAGSIWFNAIGPLRWFTTDIALIQPSLQLTAGGLTVRAFSNHVFGTADELLQRVGSDTLINRFYQDVFDLEARYARRVNAGRVPLDLTFGASYRAKHISWSFLNGDHLLHHFAGYAQAQARFGTALSAVASVRVDQHPVLDSPVFSPRLAVTLHPSARRSIRLAGSTSFRTPTMLELYLDLQNPTPIPGVAVRGQGGEVYRGGADRLRAENALSLDLSFLDQTLERFQYEVTAFYMRGTDLIELTNVIFDPLPGRANPGGRLDVGTFHFANDPLATEVIGAEAAVRATPVEGLDLFANYTFAFTRHEQGALANTDQRTPQHKVNAGAQLRTRFGLDAEVVAHFVSASRWREQDFDTARGVVFVHYDLPSYVQLNARVGIRLLDDRLEFGVTGTNLTDNRARQHPFGSPLGARVMGVATLRY